MEFLIVGIVLVGSLVIIHVKNWRLKKSNSMKSALIYELQIEELLTEIISSTSIDRAVLCRTHNGGSQILVGSEKKLSIVIEPELSLRPHTKPHYHGFPIDNHYKQVILRCMQSERMIYDELKELPPGLMQRKMEADNLTAAVHIPIGSSKESFYYLFLSTKQDPPMLLGIAKEHTIIETKSEKIKKIVTKAIAKKLLK